MARIRTIKPETFTSDDINSLPLAARWTFIGLWCYVDDKGRGRADPRLVKAAVWPIDDTVSSAEVTQHLEEMEKRRMICRYDVDGIRYLHVVNFDVHQRINRPTESKLPECSQRPHGGLTDHSLSPHGIDDCEYPQADPLTEDSVKAPGDVTEPSTPRARAPEQGTGNREQGSGTGKGVPPPAGAASPHAENGGNDTNKTNIQRIIGAYIDGASGAGLGRPSGNLPDRVGRDAKRLLGEGVPLADLEAAATAMGAAGWHDLAVQLQRNAAARNGRASPKAWNKNYDDQSRYDRPLFRTEPNG